MYVRNGAAETEVLGNVEIAGAESMLLEPRGGAFGMFGPSLCFTVMYRRPSTSIGAFL